MLSSCLKETMVYFAGGMKQNLLCRRKILFLRRKKTSSHPVLNFCEMVIIEVSVLYQLELRHRHLWILCLSIYFLDANQVKVTATLKQEEREMCIVSSMWEERTRGCESITHACMLTDLIQLTSRSSDREASIVTPRFMFGCAVM